MVEKLSLFGRMMKLHTLDINDDEDDGDEGRDDINNNYHDIAAFFNALRHPNKH